MESAENRQQPIPDNQLEKTSDAFSKTETLKLLHDSIDRLEQTIKGISQNSITVPSSSINTLISTTQELADAVTPAAIAETEVPSPPEAKVEPPIIKTESTPPKVRTPPVKQTEQLTTVKAQKTKSLLIIAICVAAVAIAIVTVFQIWLPEQQPTLATAPESISSTTEPTTSETIPQPNSEIERSLETPLADRAQQLDDSQSDLEPIAVEIPTDSEPTSESETREIPLPPDLESPGRAKNLKMVAIQPKLSFTPEQTLIAVLQSKLANLTNDYSGDPIDSVRVDVPQSSLSVEVTDGWYELSESRQIKLANEILKRSRQLDFTKLEFKDAVGTLVARNPVIGEEIIILQNSKNDEAITSSN